MDGYFSISLWIIFHQCRGYSTIIFYIHLCLLGFLAKNWWATLPKRASPTFCYKNKLQAVLRLRYVTTWSKFPHIASCLKKKCSHSQWLMSSHSLWLSFFSSLLSLLFHLSSFSLATLLPTWVVQERNCSSLLFSY